MAESKYVENLTVSSSPHLVTKKDTRWTMMQVLIALVPATVMSIVFFGARALLLAIVCVAVSAFFEWGYEKIMKKPITVRDLSACLTGLILALNLPANFPVWMAIIGCFVSIVIVKQLFGGLGRNIANPAIVGRIVLLLSFTTQMTTWPVTRFQQAAADATTAATPLGVLANDGGVAGAPSLLNMLVGNIGGAMGETCTIALLIGGIYLIIRKVISPIIPCCFIGTVFLFSLIYYAFAGGDASAIYMACWHVLAGGVVLGAFFCATDYVTSPIMNKGKIIFGIGCGFFTMVIRLWCNYPEGVSFAILFMNALTPLIDRMTINSFYGIGKKAKEEKAKA